MGRLAEGKSPAIKQLRPWHKSLARAVLVGKRPGELAQMFGLSPGQISRIIGSPLFQAELERLEGQAEYNAVDMRKELELRQGLALEAIDRALVGGDAKTASNVAFEILDRTGFGKIQEPVKNLHAHLHLHKNVDEMSEEELAAEAQKLLVSGEEK